MLIELMLLRHYCFCLSFVQIVHIQVAQTEFSFLVICQKQKEKYSISFIMVNNFDCIHIEILIII